MSDYIGQNKRQRSYEARPTPNDRSANRPKRPRWFVFVPGFPREATLKLTFTLDIYDDDEKDFVEQEEFVEWDLTSLPVSLHDDIVTAFADDEYVDDYLAFNENNPKEAELEFSSDNRARLKIKEIAGELIDVQGGLGACVQIRYCSG